MCRFDSGRGHHFSESFEIYYMRHIPLISLFSLSLLLCSCSQSAENSYTRPTIWHAHDLDIFLKENYSVGTNEKKLISDFTAQQYKYSGYTCSDPLQCQKRLTSPSYCSKDMPTSFSVQWIADTNGTIKKISSSETNCYVRP